MTLELNYTHSLVRGMASARPDEAPYRIDGKLRRTWTLRVSEETLVGMGVLRERQQGPLVRVNCDAPETRRTP
jgi:hypothetical protein